jgi:hypothetical protein
MYNTALGALGSQSAHVARHRIISIYRQLSPELGLSLSSG